MNLSKMGSGRIRKVSLLGVLGAVALAVSSPVTNAALIGYWSFDEASGNTVYDQSGNGNNGTIFGDVSYVPGQFGTALAFDGSSTYVNVGNSAPGSILSLVNTSFTIAFWMNQSVGSGATQRIINKDDGLDFGGGYSIYTTDTGVLGTTLNTGSNNNGSFGSAIPASEWLYITVTYDLSTGLETVYQNAVQIGSKAITGTIQDQGSDPLVFGQIPVFEQWYKGSLDEIRMYNTALTQPEIAAIMSIPEVSTSALLALGGAIVIFSLKRRKLLSRGS